MPKPTLKKRADGRYRCVYHGRTFYGKTQSEAYALRDEFIAKEKAGLKADSSRMTVMTYAQKWLPVHKSDVTARTYNAYAGLMETMCDEIGAKPLEKVTQSDIRRVYNRFLGYSESTIHKAATLCKAMFQTAQEDGYIRVNPCSGSQAQPPKGTSGTHRALQPWEIELISTTEHRLRCAAMVMLYAGLRRGEVMALTMEDVDFFSNIIHVDKAIRFDGNQPILSDPKTEAGIRDILMPDKLRTFLLNRTGLILPSAEGDYLTETGWSNSWTAYMNALSAAKNGCEKRWWHRTKEDRLLHPELHERIDALLRAGREEEAEQLRLSDWVEVSFRAHDLRHTYCTMLRDAGIDMKTAMTWLGHADEKMILRIYDHPSAARFRDSVDKMNQMLSKGQNKGQHSSSAI